MTTRKSAPRAKAAPAAKPATGTVKTLLAKGTGALSGVTDFSKGNAAALVASTKILGEGLKQIGSAYAAESRSAMATVTSDIKAIAAVKTPAELFGLQAAILERNLGLAKAFGTRQAEALTALARQAAAPISGRVSLAAGVLRKAA